MSASIDVRNPEKPKRVAIIASNPATSKQTGWPIGFWWGELTHPYWEFVENGYQVEIFSPDGGKLQGDSWSDPRDGSKYSAEDLLSLGFINSPEHAALVENSKAIESPEGRRTSTASCLPAARVRCTPSSTMSACTAWQPGSTRRVR